MHNKRVWKDLLLIHWGFLGKAECVPRLVQKWLERERVRRSSWLRVLWWLGVGAGIRVSHKYGLSLCGINVLMVPKQETARLYFVQIWMEEVEVESWKLLAIKYQKWTPYFTLFLSLQFSYHVLYYFVGWSRIKETSARSNYWLKKKIEELERKRREDLYWFWVFFLEFFFVVNIILLIIKHN